MYLNAYGKIRRLTAWQRVKDRWRGFIRGLSEREFDYFADHSIMHYVEHIRGRSKRRKSVDAMRPCRSSGRQSRRRRNEPRRGRA